MPGAEPTVTGADLGPRSRLLPGTRRGEAGEIVRTGSRRVEHGRAWSWSVLGGTVGAGVLGVVLVALAVRIAEHGGGSGGSGAGLLTWVGVGVAVIPAAAVACGRDVTAAARWTALATAAVATVVPVGLRSGGGPGTAGDLVHYAHLSALRSGAPLLPDRLPSVVIDQPGLAALTTAVWRVSGLTVWHSALVVVVLVHVAAVVGVRTLVRALGLGERTAVLAAIGWSLAPAVLVATSRVSGTALGLALLLWALAAVVQAATSATPGRRRAWTATGIGLAAAVAVTDLAAAWTLVGLVLLLGAVTLGVEAPPVAGRDIRRAWWPVAAGVLAVTVVWSVLPTGRAVLGDLGALGAEHQRAWSTGAGGATFGGLALVVGLGLAGAGVVRLRERLGETGPRLGLAVAALFPVSLLGLAAGPTSTLAIVLWPVLTAGLAPFVASGVLGVWDLGARRTRSAAPGRSVSGAVRHVQRDTRAGEAGPPDPGRRDRRLPLPVAATAALVAVALVTLGGSVATAPSAAEPVGTPITAGATSTTELLAVASRLADLAGPGFRFAATDPHLGSVLALAAGGVEVRDPAVDLLGDPADLEAPLRAARIDWVVDTTAGGTPTLALVPFLIRVVGTPTLTVYRVRPAVPGVPADATVPDVVAAGGS